MNPNVRLYLLFTVLWRVTGSLSLRNVMSIYVYLLSGGSNSTVGLISGLNGVVNLALALPAGYFADKVSRQLLLRIAGGVGVAATLVTVVAVATDKIWLFYAFNALWGAFEGLQSAPLSALFADSVPTGGRSGIFSAQYAISEGSEFVGPLLTVLLFAGLGNDWEAGPMRVVMYLGMVFGLASSACLYFFADDVALGLDSEAVSLDAVPLDGEEQEEEEEDDDGDLVGDVSSDGAELALLATRGDVAGDAEVCVVEGTRAGAARQRTTCFGLLTPRAVPFLLVATDLCFAWGAGMTVAYFSLWLTNEYHLSPIGLSLVVIAGCFATIASTTGAQRISQWFGRLQTSITFKFSGIACLVTLSIIQPLWLIVVLFVVRVAFARAGVPLDRSIVMDVVSKEMRGRWNTFEAIGAVSFTGSAVIGGYLVDATSYRTTFLITAALYSAGTSILIPILPFVPRSEKVLRMSTGYAAVGEGEGEGQADGGTSGGSELEDD
ncbi:major facilitator superfamily transporter [Thecamonas trahens ATCC 50062]|uniref:Major facilitator superfamily transporter n=1 Tax=Thecamonas trahens ATCC 50062 TaxID=461836 RepID=A0A0L0DQ28_THETB|nr:major facilitator superfamily transporter [Thecamonas trahens ATCC 50062]KNC54407.1 major facilitator superfamily transporter [Thecamonas trahens ATCC 50062]|eukprot:XP_013753704.1 major facilitator superfamily transporter [Thecamonas trahens ATCC 50062]